MTAPDLLPCTVPSLKNAAPYLLAQDALRVALTIDSGKALREAADYYKVDVAAITSKVKQESAAKGKSKTAKKVMPKPPAKLVKGARAA
jgi:ParB family chromosome partitioning protein